jgi:hypothetical protein
MICFITACSSEPPEEDVTAEIRVVSGAPALHINGKPVPFLTHNFAEARYMDTRWNDVLQNFVEDGVNIIVDWEYFAETWKGPGEFDFSYDDAKWERVHRLAPNAHIMPWIVLGTPMWWDELYPQELNVWENGTKGNLRPGRLKGSATRNPTVGSDQWLNDISEALRTYIRHQRSQPWGKKIIGYTIGLGPDGGGAYMWYEPKEGLYMADYSDLVCGLFQQWLRKQYDGDVGRLRKAWNDTDVTFETARMPSAESRKVGTLFELHDPALSRPMLDAARFNGDRLFEFLNHIVGVIKEETNGKKIVGMGLAGGATLSSYPGTNTHGRERTDYRMVTESKVDFVESILSYFNREAGTGDSNYDSAIDSIGLHGKMHHIQDDTRTWMTILQYAGSQNAERARNWQKIRNERDSAELLKRNMGPALLRNQAMYWLPHGIGWYESEGTREGRRKLSRLLAAKIPWGTPPPAEVALIVDPESTFYESSDYPVSLSALRQAMDRVLGRIGAPWDVLYLNDLEDPRVGDYKVYIVANAHHMDGRQREILKSKVRRPGVVTVFSFADGLIDDERLDATLMTDVSGIGMGLRRARGTLKVETLDSESPFLEDISAGTTWGIDREVGPLPYVHDAEAHILGHYPDGGPPSFASKIIDGAISIYSAAPTPPAEILRNVYRQAGVHLYLESGDVLHAKGDFVMLHTSHSARQKVRLPAEVEMVYDVFENRILAEDTAEFVSDLDDNSTGWYFCGSRERFQQIHEALQISTQAMPIFDAPASAKSWSTSKKGGNSIHLLRKTINGRAGDAHTARTSPRDGVNDLEFAVQGDNAANNDYWLELEYFTDHARDASGETIFAGLQIHYSPKGKPGLALHGVFRSLYSGTQGRSSFMPYGNAKGWRKYYLLLEKPDFSRTPALLIRTNGVVPLHIRSLKMWPANNSETAPPINREWGF